MPVSTSGVRSATMIIFLGGGVRAGRPDQTAGGERVLVATLSGRSAGRGSGGAGPAAEILADEAATLGGRRRVQVSAWAGWGVPDEWRS
jgi:hypothetical protein